jgi:hypothetical protein
VKQWLSDLGLTVIAQRDLPPAGAVREAGLTVSMWVAERPQVAGAVAAGSARLERIT